MAIIAIIAVKISITILVLTVRYIRKKQKELDDLTVDVMNNGRKLMELNKALMECTISRIEETEKKEVA